MPSRSNRSQLSDHSNKAATAFQQSVEEGVEALKAAAGETGDQAAAAQERVIQALEKAKDTYAQALDKAKAGAKAADELVHQYPYAALGTGLGIGVLIGLFIRRR